MNTKKTLRVLLIALFAVLLVSVLALGAAAEESTYAFEVLDDTGESVDYYETMADAVAALEEGFTLKLHADHTATGTITLDCDIAWNLDATGYTLTGSIAQSAGTVTVKGGTFTTSSGVLWLMSGSNTNLTVEAGAFTNTAAASTTANSTDSALFQFKQTEGTVAMDNVTLTSNGTIFYYTEGTQAAPTDVDLTLRSSVQVTTKTYGVYSQQFAQGDITIAGGTWTVGGRILHVCGGTTVQPGTITINGGTFHSYFVADDTYKDTEHSLTSDQGGPGALYIGRNYGLTITAGTFTFDGPGISTWNNNQKISITGGSFKNTHKNAADSQTIMFYAWNIPNAENEIKNATFESWTGSSNCFQVGWGSNKSNRGLFTLGDNSAMKIGEGTVITANGAGHAVHVFGAGPHHLTFSGGTVHSDTGAAYHDSGHDKLCKDNTTPITFCGTVFESGRVGDNGVIELHSYGWYLIDGGTYRHLDVRHDENNANVLFSIWGQTSITIKKGTFICGNFLRIGGSSATAAGSAMILIDPAKDSDILVEGGAGIGPMIWYQGNANYYPTLIITGGIFRNLGTSGYLFTFNDNSKGNFYIFGGQFEAPNKSIFGFWSASDTNLYVYGGTFTAKERIANVDVNGNHLKKSSIDITAEFYGAGTAVTLTWPEFNANAKLALQAAGKSDAAGMYSFTTAGVTATTQTANIFAVFDADTTDAANAHGSVTFYGGTYKVTKGTGTGMFNDDSRISPFTFNFYGGSYTYTGDSRMFKIYSGSIFNFYGGSFTMPAGGSDIIATGTGASGEFNFYGAGTYNGVETEGVTMTHLGGAVLQEIFESDANTTETVTIYGGTFITNHSFGTMFNLRHNGGFEIKGGTFTGNGTFVRVCDTARNVKIGNATVSLASGPSAILYITGTAAAHVTLAGTDTANTLTFYRGTDAEFTTSWSKFIAKTIAKDLSDKFDTADAEPGAADGDSFTTLTDAILNSDHGGDGIGNIILLDDIDLANILEINATTLEESGITELVIWGNEKRITAINAFDRINFDGCKATINITGNGEATDNIKVTFKNVVFLDEQALSISGGAEVVLDTCTLKSPGSVGGMITMYDSSKLTLNACTLTSTKTSFVKPGDTDPYGVWISLEHGTIGFTGSVTMTGGTVTGGAKLVFAHVYRGNVETDVAAGTTQREIFASTGSITVKSATLNVWQTVLYSQWTEDISATFENCSSTSARLLHICGGNANYLDRPGGTYTVEDGTYAYTYDLSSIVYSGANRHSTVNITGATMTGAGNVFDFVDTKATVDGGTYTSNATNAWLLHASMNNPSEARRALYPTVLQNATFKSNNITSGVASHAPIWISQVSATIQSVTSTARDTCALYVDGGARVTVKSGSFSSTRTSTVATSSNIENSVTIEGGTFENKGTDTNVATEKYCGYVFQPCGGTHNIYGGTFKNLVASDACISVEGANAAVNTVNIYGGYFENSGMCTLRVLAGSTHGEYSGTVFTKSNAILNVKGGVFVLAYNKDRANNANLHCGVVRCGGGSTYGAVNIEGGTFINQQPNASTINKNNAASSLTVTGGTFLTVADFRENQAARFYNQSQVKNSTAGTITVTENNKNVEKTTIANTPVVNIPVFGATLAANTNATTANTAHATFSYGGREYYAIGKLAGEFDAIEAGAQIRLRTSDGTNGLRFVSTFSAETIAAITAAAEEAGVTPVVGTLITATKNIFEKADGIFTIEALGGEAKAGVNYLNIVAENGITENEDGSLEVRAALVNIKAKNYQLSYSAVSYIKVGDTYYYSDFNVADNSRTVAAVAAAALADETGSLPCYDDTGAATGESTSPYTKAQQQVLYTYLGKTWTTTEE